jgi:hypothetical protein
MKRHRTNPLAKLDLVQVLSRCAIGAALAGLLAELPGLPVVVRALCLALFVFVAPGAAVLVWARQLPSYVIGALVPVVGIAVTLLAAAAASMLPLWQPRLMLLAMAVAALSSGTHVERKLRRQVAA